MPGVGETLTEKVGPLPTWAWAGIVTAGLGGFLIYRKKQQVNAAQAANANAGSTNLGTVPISNLTTAAEPMPIQMGDTFVNSSTTTDVTGVTGPTGPAGPPGPAGPKGPAAKPPPAAPAPKPTKPTPAAPTKAKTQTYIVKAGDNLWDIAKRFYGNGALWQNIYTANKGVIGGKPDLIHPGQHLIIPPKP